MKKSLKIYKASAGSGKTFTLALEYIKLLITNPYAYRSILAVTFTNKATAEMKERILGKLYGVANRSDSAKDYLNKIKEHLPHLEEEKIISQAKLALELILHDYGHFKIMTIDSFFQTVLRGLARELDLNGDMEISIDGGELLEDAVDTYIKQLEPETSKIGQVVNYIEEQLENDGDWHVDKEIKKFAKNILEEEYQERGEELRREIEKDNGKALEEFRTNVLKEKKECERKISELADKFFEITASEGLTVDDFTGKTRGSAWAFFEKIRKGDVPEIGKKITEMMGDPDKISKTAQCRTNVAALLKDYDALLPLYTSCILSMSHYHQLGMLNNIAETLKEENSRENRFILSETTYLLSSMIKENTSFIFEKIGTEIDHIFIDEFQDTSRLQWICFEVLLKEILSRGNFNLIVGDVKQAIYRWRNSDWKIMNNIDSYFKEFGEILEFETPNAVIDGVRYQSVNYRSDRRIIAFNNRLFRNAINTISTRYKDDLGQAKLKEITNAYSDVEQAYPIPAPGKSPKPEKGYVQVNVLDSKDKTLFMTRLMETLHMLIEEKGVAPKDIAILVRTSKEISNIVEEFKKEFPKLKIVSDDAYKLSSSLTVSLAVAAMRYIALPEDKINIANLLNLYNKVILKSEQPLEEYVSRGELIEMLPAEFRTMLDHLKGLPVYEMIEQLMSILNIESAKGEEAYVYAFLDYASQFINGKSADLLAFLEAWDEGICDKCIPVGNDDSIRVMTIHKSKGLEFHTVIMPFCNWKLTADSRNLLWCEPTVAPFKGLSLIPVMSKKEMNKSVFCEDYHKEFMYQIVDNLNILYVGTTRAKSNLFMISEKRKKDGDSHYIWHVLNPAVSNMRGVDGGEIHESELEDVYTYGEVVPSKEEKPKEDKGNVPASNPFETEPIPLELPLTFHSNRIEVRQSRELTRFLANDEEKKTLKNIAEGELMHIVMSGINTADDIDRALDRLLLQGVIDDAKHFERIKDRVVRAIANPEAKEWFNGSYRLYNECTILSADNDTNRRPDRVMIKGNEAVVVDYKFGRQNDEHDKQVRRYMELLTKMGYENVKGYLWYVYKNEIKPVEL